MQRNLVRDGLRFKLAQRYEENPRSFLSLSKQTVDSAFAREMVAELRNEGHVEEDVRGMIRLTPPAVTCQNDPRPCSYEIRCRYLSLPRYVSPDLSPRYRISDDQDLTIALLVIFPW
jgi:hypothetical protein